MRIYDSGQQVWKAQLRNTVIVMASAFVIFNTLHLSSAVPETWPYGTSVTTFVIYLFSNVFNEKVALVVGLVIALIVLILIGMKVRPILRTAMSPNYKGDTILNILLFVVAISVLPAAIYWAATNAWPGSWHYYVNTLFVALVGAVYFSGKTHGATQFAETRTRATDSIEETGTEMNDI